MNNRKFIILLSFLMLFIFGFVADIPAQTKKNPAKSAGQPLPNLTLNTLDGGKWSLRERRGNIVLINFWATWCAPCRAEIPYLVRLSAKYKKQNVEVVGITVDSENLEQINKFVSEFKIDYPVLLPVPGSLLSQQKAVPMSMLIDEKGILAKKYVGAVSERLLETDIKILLKKKPSL